MYEFYQEKHRTGLFLSVKLPGPEVGKGIHLTMLYKKNGKIYNIFTKPKNGPGHFRSGYIRRSHLWKKNVDKVVHQGLFIFNTKYRKYYIYKIKCKYNSYQYASKLINIALERYLYYYDYVRYTRSKEDVIKVIKRYNKLDDLFNEDEYKTLSLSELRKKYLDIDGELYKIEKME